METNMGKCTVIVVLVVLSMLHSNASAFDDSISILGRVKWNYTMYEENLWTRQYKNVSLEQIYHDHTDFIERVNQVYNVTDCFYPVLNVSSIVEYWSENATNVDNRFHVPVVPSVILANAHVNYFWMKFSNWTHFKESNMLDVLIDDAIPSLQMASKQFWNESNTDIFFGFLKDKSYACSHIGEHELSTYKLAEKYFIDTIAVQLKTYIMLQLSYLTKAAKDFLYYHKIARDRRVAFNYKYAAFTQQTEALVWNLSQVVWSCDDFNASDSHTQLTNFIQGYIDNEINLNPYGSCAPYCTDYKVTRNYECHEKTICAANYYDKNKTRCDGIIRNCDYFDSMFTYCPNEKDNVTDRRIDYVQLGSGKTLGNKYYCPDKFDAKPFATWIFSCRYCFCYCDAPGPRSDRHFSLREVTSNIKENRVISGIRLVKNNGIIHLIATERTLLPNAMLNASETYPVANNSYKMDDENIRQGVDYHTLTYENRTINLDTISSARDQLVTGVRFSMRGGTLHLEARFTYFDEATGKLDLTTNSIWIRNTNMDRNKIQTSHLGVPTEYTNQSIALGSKDKDSVDFNPTGWTRDMAQTTVPFIDSIQLEPYENVALHGIGIFYKAQIGHGGYIAPKLITYDYAASAMRIRGAVGVYGV